MESFMSSALGSPYEYRAKFFDTTGLVILAKAGRTGGDLHCRPKNSTTEYGLIYHTEPQVKQVLLDMDAAQMQSSGQRSR